MPSYMIGLRRELTWDDFTPRPEDEDTQNSEEYVEAAHINAPWKQLANWTYHEVPRSNPRVFRLGDNLVLEVTVKREETWVKDWVANKGPEYRDDLLHHEQGHYNISALITRDYLVDFWQLTHETFPSVDALRERINQIKANTVNKIQAVQYLYDNKVHPEQKDLHIMYGREQRLWDRFIREAFDMPSNRHTATPDGTPLKVRLIDRIELVYPVF